MQYKIGLKILPTCNLVSLEIHKIHQKQPLTTTTTDHNTSGVSTAFQLVLH